MKTTHLPIACLFVITGLISCNNNDEQKQESIPGTGALQTASGLTPLDTLKTTNQVTTPGTLVMNPEHGAPGHRCDIAVGAPLNTAVANKPVLPATQPLAQPPVQLSSPNQAAPNNSVKPVIASPATAGINPAHGAPGHRCDIAVGAPLNSAPTNSTPAPAPIQIPAPAQQKTINANSTAKINPAHGQPGHDCSVPVGQPLKQ